MQVDDNLGTEIDEKEEVNDIEKKEQEATEAGEIDFQDDELEEEVKDEVTSDEDSTEKPIIIDGQEYTTDQIKELIAKKPEPTETPKVEVDKLAKIKELKERVKGDEELSEILDLVGNTQSEVEQITKMKKEMEDMKASENARTTLLKAREVASKELGIDLPDLDDPEVKAFFQKELQTMNPYKLFALWKGLKPKSKADIAPNLEDQTAGLGRSTGDAEQIEYFAKKLGAKNPKNALKGYKG